MERPSNRSRTKRRRSATIVSTLGLVAGLLAFAPGLARAGPLEGRIVYTDVYGGSGLYTLAPDGTDRSHLVSDDVSRPRWLPDGSGVSFIVDFFGASVTSRLETVDPTGADRKILLRRAELPTHFKIISTYDWSTDGTQLALCLLRFTDQGVAVRTYVSTPDGSTMLLVIKDACGEDWGSQDRILAYSGSKLFAVDPDGGNVDRIRTGVKTWDAQWSPDGTKLVFMCGPQAAADVCVADGDGSHLHNLTNSARADWSPSWSPDGSRIVWTPGNRATGYGDLWRMLPDGSGKTRVTESPDIDEYDPDWTALG
jgi:TolB protein